MRKLFVRTALVLGVAALVGWPSGAQAAASSNFSTAVPGFASASANVTYVDGEEIRVNSLSVSDLRVDSNNVYAYFVVYNETGSTAKTTYRYNRQDANTTLTWRNLRITDEHYGLKKLQLVVCVDDWGSDTCRGSRVQINPNF
ncbi:hypothetical protein [Microtetraspora glauca]|uniref:Secreted protein n=1 Tax=Microtetraspora glauca TaxID=1996 RepID=A0ABV3GMS2_MICGL